MLRRDPFLIFNFEITFWLSGFKFGFQFVVFIFNFGLHFFRFQIFDYRFLIFHFAAEPSAPAFRSLSRRGVSNRVGLTKF